MSCASCLLARQGRCDQACSVPSRTFASSLWSTVSCLQACKGCCLAQHQQISAAEARTCLSSGWQAYAESSCACRHARGAALGEPCDSACSVPSRTSRVAELKQALSQQGQQAKPLALAPRPSPGRGRVAQLLERLSGASTQTAPTGGTRSGRCFGRILRQKLGRWVGVSARLAAVGCGQ